MSTRPSDPTCLAQAATATPAPLPEGAVMTFARRPGSPAAIRLRDALHQEAEAWERRSGRRKRGRSRQQRRAFLDALARLLAELILSIDEDAARVRPCPKRANAFTRLPLGYRSFRAVYDAFLGLGLIEVVTRGYRRRFRFDPDGPECISGGYERLQATPALVTRVRAQGIAPGTAAAHVARLEAPRPLELRAGARRQGRHKERGAWMAVPQDATTRRLEAEVEELGRFVRSAGVEGDGIEFTGFTRGFNRGDEPAFAWDLGGRLYAGPRDNSYQSRPKAARLGLRLAGEPVVEIDITASHLAIACALRGCSLRAACEPVVPGVPADPYAIDGLPRAVVKAWITHSLGAGHPLARWPADTLEELRADPMVERDSLLTAPRLGEVVLRRYPVLAAGDGLGWARLQYLESQAILLAMLELKRTYGIPALPVHDSLIVPGRHAGAASRVLEAALTTVTGQPPLPFKIARAETPRRALPEAAGRTSEPEMPLAAR